MSAPTGHWCEHLAELTHRDRVHLQRGVCPLCGHHARLELHEVWGHDFMIDACCEDLQDIALRQMSEDQSASRWLLEALLHDVGLDGLRGLADDGLGSLKLNWRLRIKTHVSQKEAKAFIRRFHRHLEPPQGWVAGARIDNGHMGGQSAVAVVWLAHPVARGFTRGSVLEVRRMCVRDDLTEALVYNACSMGYGWAARKARDLGAERVVTYVRADEHGASLRAAGYEPVAHVRARSWSTPSRPRCAGELIAKVRWEKILRKARPTVPAQAQSRKRGLVAEQLVQRHAQPPQHQLLPEAHEFALV